jgi:hypothetical protein
MFPEVALEAKANVDAAPELPIVIVLTAAPVPKPIASAEPSAPMMIEPVVPDSTVKLVPDVVVMFVSKLAPNLMPFWVEESAASIERSIAFEMSPEAVPPVIMEMLKPEFVTLEPSPVSKVMSNPLTPSAVGPNPAFVMAMMSAAGIAVICVTWMFDAPSVLRTRSPVPLAKMVSAWSVPEVMSVVAPNTTPSVKVFTPPNVCALVSTTPATDPVATETAKVMSSGVDAPVRVQVVPATEPEADTFRKLALSAAELLTVMLSPPPPDPQASAALEMLPELSACKQTVPLPAREST